MDERDRRLSYLRPNPPARALCALAFLAIVAYIIINDLFG